MDDFDVLTDGLVVTSRRLFAPDWSYLANFPTLEVRVLCALSVGIHPFFASPAWTLNVAIPYFNGWRPWARDHRGVEAMERLIAVDDVGDETVGASPAVSVDQVLEQSDEVDSSKALENLSEFLRRTIISVANLSPSGSLTPMAEQIDGESTRVRVDDFATWANEMGWALPEQFPRSRSNRDSRQNVDQLRTEPHVSDKLAILNQAARKFWGNADRDQPDTQKKNSEVITWLEKKGFPSTLAAKGATIIRPKWAHRGRKPEN
jgi:hypothetical protein